MSETANRFARVPLWAASLEISSRAWRVLTVIAVHLDRTGWACPSLSRIAAMTGIARNKICPAINELENAGLVHRNRSKGGRGNSTRYQVVFKRPETGPRSGSVFGGETGPAGGAVFQENRSQVGTCLKAEIGPANFSKQVPSWDLRLEQKKEESLRARESWFIQFWEVYPSCGLDGKEASRREFIKVLERGVSPEEIIAGAKIYGAHIRDSGTPPRFVKAAANWLKEDRWNDRPRPAEAPPKRYGTGLF